MAPIYDCSTETELLSGMRLARAAIGRGELVVMPTDTVYGIAADAFDPSAVQRLLDAKGRGRSSPPPVLVASLAALDALAETVPDVVLRFTSAFWPGPLTIVLPAQPSLAWDLGDTNGTVALRMPDQPIALELLADTGPLAVSSANRTGRPPATTAQLALDELGESVSVYLDAGPTPGMTPSTIIDATALAAGTGPLRILRAGALDEATLRAVAPEGFEQAPTEQDGPE